MSDDMLIGDSHHGYGGRDGIPFASGDATEENTGTIAAGDGTEALAEPVFPELREAAIGILLTAGSMNGLEADRIVAYSKTLNSLCRSVLENAEERIRCVEEIHTVEPEISVKNRGSGRSVSEMAFPSGSVLSRDDWSKLCSLLADRLDRYGCIITQRDRKFLSSKSGIEISSYMWSTLVKKLDLRRVKNPYSASSLVIYVPRAGK